MTAYGRKFQDTEIGTFLVEIQSVNRKFLEVNILLPKEFFHFEEALRKLVSSKVTRGQVSVKISVVFKSDSPLVVKPNLVLARQIFSAVEELKKEFQLTESMNWQTLLSQPDILSYQVDDAKEKKYYEVLEEVFLKALQDFLHMKQVEGISLQNDILARLDLLQKLITAIESKTPNAANKYRLKLTERLNELFSDAVANEDKILREIALFAEKIDISEEITRFKSHLIQFQKFLLSEEFSIGKTLDFIIQELNREVNTINSKSSDLEITQNALAIKSELEKIREQIQNVE